MQTKVDRRVSRNVKQQGVFAKEESTTELEKEVLPSSIVEPTTYEVDIGLAIKKPKKSGVRIANLELQSFDQIFT